MKNKYAYILLLSALSLTEPVFAITLQSQNALNAFRRYEPMFSMSLKNLQDLNRKLEKYNEDKEFSKVPEVLIDAENIMNKVEDSYKLMDNLYTNTLSKNPGDSSELREGFDRFEDVYRRVRDYYLDNFSDKEVKEKESIDQPEPTDSTEHTEESKIQVPDEEHDSPYSVDAIAANDDYDKIVEAVEAEREKRVNRLKKMKITGSLMFEFRDSDEKHQNPGMGGTIPNDQTMGRLAFSYDINDNKKLSFEEKYLTRERNEKIKENHFTLSYFEKHDNNSAFTLRDKLQHVWYPDDSTKNYRINLFEVLYAKNWRDHERVANLGFKTKTYPRNSRSDYNQYIIGDQESWNLKDTIIYAEFTNDIVKYKNVDNLDYNNFNLYTEINKSYSGNKAEMRVSNTYDRRTYENESLVAFRTSYYDDFFQFDYNLPVNDKVTYSFNGEYNKRNYGSDEPRGYSEINVFNGFTVKTDDRSYWSGDYRYIYNDENTRDAAHKNNIFHVGWVRNVNKDYRIKFDETYHNRNSVQNAVLDFEQNDFVADLSWRLKKDYKFSWITEHFIRRYDDISINVADYRFLESGFNISFYKRKCYDWRITQKWRNMEYKNWGGVPSGWTSHVQPVTEIYFNRWLRDDLKLAVRATWEKTYYSEFNNDSQELEYNFGDLVYNKQIYASLEYTF